MEKAEAFRHRREKKYEEQLASRKLLSALPDAVAAGYRCTCTTANVPQIGTRVLLYKAHFAVSVLYLNKRIGVVMSADAAELLTLMQNLKTEAFAAEVIETRPMSRGFLVQLIISSGT